MQALYAVDWNNGTEESIKYLRQNLEMTRRLFIYLILVVTEVARYAEKDAIRKAGKHLPSASDLNVNTKLAGNEVLWAIIESAGFKAAVQDAKLASLAPEDLVKKLYLALLDTEAFAEYAADTSRVKKEEKKILDFIFNHVMLPSEDFINHIEENFYNWDDDGEMMQSLVPAYFNKIQALSFDSVVGAEKWQFARELVQTVMDKHDHVMDIVKPKLRNWDADRIAQLDLILIQMGVCEFLYFETIPTRVTLNEYIDIAKAYSTPQSGQFVNGILDSIHKDLTSKNLIEKINFKKPV